MNFLVEKFILPKVSICTPTFNRRPFIPMMIECFNNQTYPKDKIEWIIIDDGTDKIEDLVTHIPQVKYFYYPEKLTLGKKRNIMHEKTTGEIIIYMDDDDYYPPERISHAVETLQNNPQALCAGSSEMYIYFKHIQKMYQCGPYKENHSTAATFAFRRELLKQTRYDDNACLAEETHFLKNYTIPFVQLDPLKSILVFSHNHNSFDKKILLDGPPNKYVKVSEKRVTDFIKEPTILNFFMVEIDELLENYEPGNPKYKPDVSNQMKEIQEKRNKMIEEQKKQQDANLQMNNIIQNSQNVNYTKKIEEQNQLIMDLLKENSQLKEKNEYLENKIKELINIRIKELKKE
jgi:glycosyltransferase involved in cell wall biosynthesis|uniref:Glycosyltransferase 2-like domain-containing protein n=1 Tax=viral metagenome TaxID=1070528 RepID=A0A6C0CWM3_9ZZZZ